VLLQWDNVGHQFIFQLDANPAVTHKYPLKDTAPPQNLWDKKYMGVQHWVPNCVSGQTQAYMSINVDDVWLNTAATAAALSPIVGMDVASPMDENEEADFGDMEPVEP
jgi:hypothetical protein